MLMKFTNIQACISLTLEDQQQALLLLTAYFSLRDSLKHGCPFLFEELTKGAERT